MTSTPSGSKGKGRAPTNWRLRALSNTPTPEQLGALRLPFDAMSEQKDSVPAALTGNVHFLPATVDGAPWTGYYATY
jgi:hypothetical protein